MEYKIGNAKKIKELGETAPLTCPKCQQKVTMSVYANGELTLVPQFPIVKSGTVYFAVCPSCSSVFGIEARAGQTFSKGEKLALGNFDIKDLEQFHV